MHKNEDALLNQPVKAGCDKQAVILQPPAFQAGCRGFEPRLPLLSIGRLCAGRSQAVWEQPDCDTASKEAVLAAIQRGRMLFPFPILGIDTDNGGEFINEVLIAYCEQEQITFTLGRPYLKNDQ